MVNNDNSSPLFPFKVRYNCQDSLDLTILFLIMKKQYWGNDRIYNITILQLFCYGGSASSFITLIVDSASDDNHQSANINDGPLLLLKEVISHIF